MRVIARLTHAEAAKVVHRSSRMWSRWEARQDARQRVVMDEALVELFCLKRNLPYPTRFNVAVVRELLNGATS